MVTKGSSTWRNVSEKDKILLWGRAAARCNHPDCKRYLVAPATTKDDEAMYGQAAHIVARGNEGPRSDPNYPPAKLDKYENLILLCGNCHTIVDKQPNKYTREGLQNWKEEHEYWTHQVTDPKGYIPMPWIVIVQEDMPRIDLSNLADALEHDCINNEPHPLLVSPHNGGWDSAAKQQADFVEKLIAMTKASERRFAIFSLTAIPLAVHLGFILSDRCRVALFQYYRDKGSWVWPSEQLNSISGLSTSKTILSKNVSGEVIFRISLSATVTQQVCHPLVKNPIADIHIEAEKPSVDWLVARNQLKELGNSFREALLWVRDKFGEPCSPIHLFYSGPIPGAITIGRQYNLRMNPPMNLYEYRHGRKKQYEKVLCLAEV